MNSQSHPMNPFPGLRPFTQEEDYLFFGREEQTIELLQRLAGNRFVAVVGTSGSGKSSLVRCGLLSELLGGKMLEAGASWEIAVTHPGGNPLALLTEALLEAELYDPDVEHVRENLLATLSRSHFGLVEAVKQAGLPEGTNFLLVVDQFEEVFRFHEAGQMQQEAANEFVSVLLEAVAQTEVPIYVVLTMRSDFIGECGQFEGLAEMVNRGEFLIPRLNREQYKRVIEGPIKVAGGRITPRLLQRLLNDLGQQADQLPCLQHALMRTWSIWAAKDDSDALDLDDYQRVGKMTQALSLHADEVYDSLETDRQRELCRGLFQALTVQETENRGIRRPQRLGKLCQILEVQPDELLPVIDAYRQPGVTFLMPPLDVELTDQTIIDISHESLMRVWTRLRHWVEEEAQAAGIYLRLSESAALYGQGKAGLYRDPELGIALAWREAQRPNAAWAERYQRGFDAAMAFLNASQQAAEAEEQQREAARQRELAQAQRLAEAERQRAADQAAAAVRLRRLVRGLAAVAVVAVTATVVAWLAWQDSRTNAEVAAQKATEALSAQAKTQEALTEVAAAKGQVEQNLQKKEVAEKEARSAEAAALEAEKRSRAFRYSTDMQLAGRLIDDDDTTARKIFSRLADHNPAENSELKPEEDLRDFEWYYLRRLVDSRATVLRGFDEPLSDLALTPESELVTLDRDAQLKRVHLETRQETGAALDLKQGRIVTSQALSPDGRLAAVAVAGQTTHLVDVVTGKQTVPPIPRGARNGLIFSADGRMLVTVDSEVGWWDTSTGKPIAMETSNLIIQPGMLSLSANGLTLAVGGQSVTYRNSAFSVFRMDPATREVKILLDKKEGEMGTMRSLAISPDGESLIASQHYSGSLYRFDVATGTAVESNSTAHEASVSFIGFNPKGTEMITGSLDGMIRVWQDYHQLSSADPAGLMGHTDEVNPISFAPDGTRLLSASKDQTVRIWDLNQKAASLARPVDVYGYLARFSPDGLLVAGAARTGRGIEICDVGTGRLVRSLQSKGNGQLSSVAFSPDGRLLAAGFGGADNVSAIELWDIDRGERLAVMPGTTDIPGFTTDAKNGLVSGLAFSPDGTRLVAGFGSLMSFYSSGYQANHPLKVYDVASHRTIRFLEGHRNFCVSVKFSPNGSRLASASYDGTVRIWDTKSWKTLHVLSNPDPRTELGEQRVLDAAFSPDGKLLAMASGEGSVVVWDANTGEQLQVLQGHANGVTAVAFSPLGRTLASCSADMTVRLWNTTTWRDLARLEPGVYPRGLAFSPDGRQLLVAGRNTIIWSTRPDDETASKGLASELALLLQSQADFRSRLQLLSDSARLRAALEELSKQHPENPTAQAALAASRANWHAAREEWKQAAEQFDRLRELDPPDAWLRASELLRLATALLHEDRPVDAATLLTGGEQRRLRDGGTRATAFGYAWVRNEFPLRLTRVFRNSPMWRAGMRAGDLLLRFNGTELTARTFGQYSQLIGGPEGTRIAITYRRGESEPETVEVVKSSFIMDDEGNLLVEQLLAAVKEKLAQTPDHPGLLELRAELAGQSSDFEQQVADYSAAIAALSERPEGDAAADLSRLHRRRGNAYLGLKQWQAAHDDYDEGITDETTDEALLANQALAETEVLLDRGLAALQPSEREQAFHAAQEFSDPWQKRAIAYRFTGNQQAIDRLVERRPGEAGPIGDVFTSDVKPDWQRATEIYSKGITPETNDAELLAKRARAYEQLQNWEAAAADWRRVAGANPEGAGLLEDFAARLVKSGQPSLARAQQQRARQLLETTLAADPGDALAIDALARLLVELNEPQEADWTALIPAELKTAGGMPLALQDDNSLLAERSNHAIILPDSGNSLKAIRVETSPHLAPPNNATPGFTEYRILSTALPPDGFRGRYVRLDLPGDNEQFPRKPSDGASKSINLAELQVFRGDENLALGKAARQSSTLRRENDGTYKAGFAVDGRTTATEAIDVKNNPFAETNYGASVPWWEVDLGAEHSMDRIVVWNRTGQDIPSRMNHFRIRVLDESRRVVFEQVIDKAPNPSLEITRQVQLAKTAPDATDGSVQWQLHFGSDSWRRFRISATEDVPALVGNAIETQALNWSVPQPTLVTPASHTTLTAQPDGLFLVGAPESDTLALPTLPTAVKVIRVETASISGPRGSATPAFGDYRIEAVDAPHSDTGALKGRFVRIDLPGDNQQFPRRADDGANKFLNLQELQVFSGDGNIALRKPARQSSDTSAATKAELAVDGKTEGPLAHTQGGDRDPWWEVDLGSEQAIDRIVVWNRTDGDTPQRMNHFRVRVLDASRRIVMAQVIDEAPKPSREIFCRSLLVDEPPATDAVGLRRFLRLGRKSGIDPLVRFRISSSERLSSLDQEAAHAKAKAIPLPVARLAAAYDLNGETIASADWFGRALTEAKTDNERISVLKQLQEHPEPLADLLARRPDDIDVRLALARRHVAEGQQRLARDEAEQALAAFQTARDIFTRLLDQHPEPDWVVLEPTEMTSEGGATLTLMDDSSIVAGGENPAHDTYRVKVRLHSAGINSLLLELIPVDPGQVIGRGPDGNFILSNLAIKTRNARNDGGLRQVEISDAVASYEEETWFISNALDGMADTAWAVYPNVRQRQSAVFQISDSAALSDNLEIELTCRHPRERTGDVGFNIARFRLSAAADPRSFTAARLHRSLPGSELAALDVAIGNAYVQQKNTAEAAAAFGRALDRVEQEDERKQLIEQFQKDQPALRAVAQRRPEDVPLQLVLARRLAQRGKNALANGRQEQALRQLSNAQEIFAKLAVAHPQAEWTVLEPTEMTSAGGADLTLESDGSIFASGENPLYDTYEIVAPAAKGRLAGLRLEAVPDRRLPGGSAGRWTSEPFMLADVTLVVRGSNPDGARPLAFRRAFADFSENGQDVSNAIDSDESSVWGVGAQGQAPHVAVFMLDQPAEVTTDDQLLMVRIKFGRPGRAKRSLGRFRLSVTGDPNALEAARFEQQLKASGLADLQVSLGNAQGREGHVAEAAAAFGQALDLASERDSRLNILKEASAHEGVLEKLAELRPADAVFHDALARHFQQSGNHAGVRAAAATARTLYEQQLAAEPGNSRLANDLADLLLEVSRVPLAVLKPVEARSAGGAEFTPQNDGSLLVSGPNLSADTYTVQVQSDLDTIRTIRLEVIPDDALPHKGPGRHPTGNFQLAAFQVFGPAADGQPQQSPLAISKAKASFAFGAADADIAGTIDERSNKVWHVWTRIGQRNYADYELAEPLQAVAGKPLTIVLKHQKYDPGINLGRFRLSATGAPIEIEANTLAAANITAPWSHLGVAYYALGEFDQALDAFARSIELARTDHARAAAAQTAAAFEDVFARLLERFPDDKPLRLGQAKYAGAKHVEEGQFQAAVELLSGALADFPDDVELLNLRAGALMKLRQWQDAAADYARVAALETDDRNRRAADYSRAECQLRVGGFQDAADAYLQEMLLTSEYFRTRDASIAEMLAGINGTAKFAAARLFQKFDSSQNPGAPPAAWLVRVFVAQPGLVTAQNSRKLLEAARKAGGSWTAPMTAAIYYRLGDLEQAEPLLSTSEGKRQFELLAAMLLYDRGEPDAARKLLTSVESWFERERAKDPDSAVPAQQLWQLWSVQTVVWREAARKLIGPRIVELDELLAKAPGKAPERLERAKLLADAGLYQEAADDLDRIATPNVESPEVHALRGRVLAGMHRVEEALPHLNQAIEAGTEDPGAFAARGAILLQQGQTDAARADLEKSLELKSTDAAAKSLADLLLDETEKAVRWTVLKPQEMKSEDGATLTLRDDGSILAGGEHPDRDVYTVVAETELRAITAIRLEALTDDSLPNTGPGRDRSGFFVMDRFEVQIAPVGKPDQLTPAPFGDVAADYFFESQPINPASGKWHLSGGQGSPHVMVCQPRVELASEGRSRLTFRMVFDHGSDYPGLSLGRFRLSVTDAPKAFAGEKERFAAMRSDDPWIRLAHAGLAIGDLQRAANSFTRAFQRAADDAARAAVFQQVSAYGELFPEFTRRLDDDPQFHLFHGNRLASQGKWEQADAAYRKAVTLDAGCVTGWIPTGYWKVEGYPAGLDTVQPPEVGPDPFVPVANGQAELPWQPVSPNANNRFDFGAEVACHYVLTRLWSPAEQEVAVQLGDDDDLRLFVNDRLSFQSRPSGGSAQPREYEIAVKLRAGWNTVLVKIRNGGSGCSLCLALSGDPQDLAAARPGTRMYEAVQMVEAGRQDEGLAVLAGLFDEFPENAVDVTRRALSYQQVNQPTLAEADYRRAAELEPEIANRWSALANFYRLRQQWEPAIAAYSRQLEINQNDFFALMRRAPCYRALHRWDEALADYDRAAELRSGGWKQQVHNQRAILWIFRGDWKKAAAEMQQIADAGTSESPNWAFSRDLALVRFMAGDAEGYRQAAAEMLGRLDDNMNADQARWLVYVYTMAPDMITDANRDRLLAAAAKWDGSWQDHLNAALACRMGEYEKAAELFGDDSFLGLSAIAHHRLGQREKAEALLQSRNREISAALAADPHQAVPPSESWQAWALYLAVAREANQAIVEPRLAELNKAIETNPNDVSALLERAEQNDHWARCRAALADLDKVAVLKTDDVKLLARRASLAGRYGRIDRARADYENLAKLEPQNVQWSERAAQLSPDTLAVWHFDEGTDGWKELGQCSLTVADGVLKSVSTGADPRFDALASAPAGWLVLTLRARSSQHVASRFYWSTTTRGISRDRSLEFAVGATGKQWREYRLFFRTDADLTGLRLDLGGHAGQQVEIDWIRLERSDEESLRQTAAALRQRAEDGAADGTDLAQLAQLLALVDSDAAQQRYLEILTTGIDARPDNKPLRAARGKLYAQKQQWQAAIDDLNLAITAETDDAALIAARANAFKQLGKWPETVADYTQALRLQPDDPAFLYERASTLAWRLGQHEDALPDWSRLVELQPSNPWQLMNRSATYSNLGQRDKAMGDLNHAVALGSPADLWRSLQLRGVLFAQQGEWQQAAADLDKAFGMNVAEWARFEVYRDYALLQLMVGDVKGYLAGIEKLDKHLDKGTDAERLRWLVFATVAGPSTLTKNSGDRLLAIVDEQLAERHAAWQPRLKAALLYRAGQLQQAADLLDQNPRGPAWPAFQFLAAMTHHKLGHDGQAKKLLDEANDWVRQQEEKEQGPAAPSGQLWLNWVIYKSLQREAAALTSGNTNPGTGGGDSKPKR